MISVLQEVNSRESTKNVNLNFSFDTAGYILVIPKAEKKTEIIFVFVKKNHFT